MLGSRMRCYILEHGVGDTALLVGDELGLPSPSTGLPYAPQHLSFATQASCFSISTTLMQVFVIHIGCWYSTEQHNLMYFKWLEVGAFHFHSPVQYLKVVCAVFALSVVFPV